MTEMNEMTKIEFAKRYIVNNVKAYALVFVISAVLTGTLLLTLWIFGYNVEDLRVLGGVVLFTPVCIYYLYRVIIYIWLLRNYLLDSKRSKELSAKCVALCQKFDLDLEEDLPFLLMGYAKWHNLEIEDLKDGQILDTLLSMEAEEISKYLEHGTKIVFSNFYTEKNTMSSPHDFESQQAAGEGPMVEFGFTRDWYPQELDEDQRSWFRPEDFSYGENPYDDLSGNPWDEAIDLDPNPDSDSED